ncbi:MAG: CAP domain-containing protein [Chloroflexia bacterium]
MHRYTGMRVMRYFCLPALVALLVSTLTLTIFRPTPASANQTVRFYAATQHSIGGAFLKFYDRYVGIHLFGYPITDEVMENGRPVQYFERQRMEYHKEHAGTANEVQLSLLGSQKAQGRASTTRVAPFASSVDRLYVQATGHSLTYSFLSYWKAYGSVRIFGYPLTEPVNENGYLVQYFERARMEYHPEKAGLSYGIELGHLGKEYLPAGTLVAKNISLAAPAAAPAPVTSGSTDAMGNELIAMINNARQGAGIGSVALNGQLTTVSQARSNDMGGRNYFSHVSPEGTDFVYALKAAGVPFKLAGEVIAMNNYSADKTVRAAYDTYINSPPHRAIIMDGRYNTVGVGVANDGKGYYYYTVIFTQR